MLINIIFISKQTKIADFHTLYIMRCRHPKETATLKKKSKRHTDGIPHPSPSPRRAIQISSAIRRPNKFRSGRPSKKPAGIVDPPPTSQTFQRYELRRQARHLHRVAACASSTKTIASAQPHGSNSLAASQFRPTAGLKTALNVGQNRRSARK